MKELDKLYEEVFAEETDNNDLNKTEIKKEIKDGKIKKVITKIKKMPLKKKVAMAIVLCGIVLVAVRKINGPHGLKRTTRKIEKNKKILIEYRQKLSNIDDISEEERKKLEKDTNYYIDELNGLISELEGLMGVDIFNAFFSKKLLKYGKERGISRSIAVQNDVKSRYYNAKINSKLHND